MLSQVGEALLALGLGLGQLEAQEALFINFSKEACTLSLVGQPPRRSRAQVTYAGPDLAATTQVLDATAKGEFRIPCQGGWCTVAFLGPAPFSTAFRLTGEGGSLDLDLVSLAGAAAAAKATCAWTWEAQSLGASKELKFLYDGPAVIGLFEKAPATVASPVVKLSKR